MPLLLVDWFSCSPRASSRLVSVLSFSGSVGSAQIPGRPWAATWATADTKLSDVITPRRASPFLTVREAALGTPHFDHPATHCLKVYSCSVDWFQLSPRAAFMAPYCLRSFHIFCISMLSFGYRRGLRNLLISAGHVSCKNTYRTPHARKGKRVQHQAAWEQICGIVVGTQGQIGAEIGPAALHFSRVAFRTVAGT